jgi:hypothetical protein
VPVRRVLCFIIERQEDYISPEKHCQGETRLKDGKCGGFADSSAIFRLAPGAAVFLRWF